MSKTKTITIISVKHKGFTSNYIFLRNNYVDETTADIKVNLLEKLGFTVKIIDVIPGGEWDPEWNHIGINTKTLTEVKNEMINFIKKEALEKEKKIKEQFYA